MAHDEYRFEKTIYIFKALHIFQWPSADYGLNGTLYQNIMNTNCNEFVPSGHFQVCLGTCVTGALCLGQFEYVLYSLFRFQCSIQTFKLAPAKC